MRKILLADDEVRILGLLQATLEGDGRYQILVANDGAQALALCRKEKPDLVFLDLLMPGIDGYTVCRKLKKSRETSSIKVIMLTAMAQEADRRTATEVGADDYLTKPFSPNAVLAKVGELLDREERRLAV